jgi:polysaccharide export outer membrane protein
MFRNILLAVAFMFFAGAFTTAQQAPANTPSSYQVNPAEYVIGADDVLAINVWKETEISRTVQVRPDGKISLPLAGEIQAAGLQPLQLQQQIADKLKSFISDPEVTVIVQEVRSKKFNVIGEVQRPGTYALSNSSTVLDAIALAGGFKDFAKQTKIYVLRVQPNGSRTRIPFNYKKVVKGRHMEENVPLQSGDTIVVP